MIRHPDEPINGFTLRELIEASRRSARLYAATSEALELSEASPLAIGDRKHAALSVATAEALLELLQIREEQHPKVVR